MFTALFCKRLEATISISSLFKFWPNRDTLFLFLFWLIICISSVFVYVDGDKDEVVLRTSEKKKFINENICVKWNDYIEEYFQEKYVRG